MDAKRNVICNIGFAALCVGLFYLMPYIGWYTMQGDKTDILMGMAFGFIPLGLLLLSVLYGLLMARIIVPVCIAAVVGIPAIFIPIVAGRTAGGRVYALILIVTAIILIVCVGTGVGILIRRAIKKVGRSFPHSPGSPLDKSSQI